MGIREQLLAAVEASGLSLYRISEDAGIKYPAIHGFVNGDRDIRLSTVDKLSGYFRMRLTRPLKPKQTGGA